MMEEKVSQVYFLVQRMLWKMLWKMSSMHFSDLDSLQRKEEKGNEIDDCLVMMKEVPEI